MPDKHVVGYESAPWRIFRPSAVRAVITYLLVVGAVIAFSVAIFGYDDSSKAELVASYFTGLLGVVLGFFFGSRGADRAEQSARLALGKVERTVNEAESAIKQAKRAANNAPTAAERLLEAALVEKNPTVRARLVFLDDQLEAS
jgi:hypothetical protein